MKIIHFNLFLAFALLSLPGFSFGQNDQKNDQTTIELNKENFSEPFSWMVWKDQVKPNNQKAYEEKISALIEKAKKQSNFMRILTFFESTTSTYYFFYPFSESQDWHAIYSFWSKESQQLDIKKFLVNYSIFLTKSVPELSQFPQTGQVSLANPNYVHMEYFEISPDAEEKFVKLLQEWKIDSHNKAPECGWFVQKMLVGGNLPTYVLLWGDCLKNVENIKQLDRFLLDKKAYGTIVKKVISEDKVYIPKLSTAKLDLSGK